MVEGLTFVVAVILNDHDELLLLRRSPQSQRDPNKWGLSGGRLESGEEPESGMIRELGEELGIDVELRLEARLGPLPAVGLKGGLVHLFHYTWVSGQLHLNHEHTGFQWVDQATYVDMDVMPGVEADLTYFGIWPGRTGSGRTGSA